MYGTPCNFDTILQSLTLTMKTRKRRQQGRVDVDHFPGKCPDNFCTNYAHVPSTDKKISIYRMHGCKKISLKISFGRVVTEIHHYRRNSGTFCPFNCIGILIVCDESNTLSIDLPACKGIQYRLKV